MADPSSARCAQAVQHPISLREQFSADLLAYWPLWLIVAAAIFLRGYEIGRLPGMHGDEAWYGLQARRLLSGETVEWRTPTGNVPGMLHLGWLTLFHAVLPPSLLVLRLPSLISSVAALALAYLTGRRFFGPTAGITAVVLMACLPIAIAYARLGWDPSHAPLLVLAAAYAAFARRKLLCALLFALAVTNHPSAVFAAPFLTLGFLGFDRDRNGWRPAAVHAAQLAALLFLAILLGIALSPGATHYVSILGGLRRLIDLDGWAYFALMFCRLLSGDTIYTYAVGEGLGAARPWADLAVGSALAGALGAGLLWLRRRADWPMAGTIAGWLASLILLYLAAGPWVLEPELERFSFPMVPITVLALAAVLERLLPNGRRWVQPVLAAISLPLLAGFWLYYMEPLKQGRIRPAPGFWTAEQDPNRIAFQRIAAEAGPAGGARIMAEDWWLHIPISYYAAGQPYQAVDASTQAQPRREAGRGGIYWVAYGGGKLDRAMARRGDAQHRWTIATANRDNVIQIWWTPSR
jgi:hypothetical protein